MNCDVAYAGSIQLVFSLSRSRNGRRRRMSSILMISIRRICGERPFQPEDSQRLCIFALHKLFLSSSFSLILSDNINLYLFDVWSTNDQSRWSRSSIYIATTIFYTFQSTSWLVSAFWPLVMEALPDFHHLLKLVVSILPR